MLQSFNLHSKFIQLLICEFKSNKSRYFKALNLADGVISNHSGTSQPAIIHIRYNCKCLNYQWQMNETRLEVVGNNKKNYFSMHWVKDTIKPIHCQNPIISNKVYCPSYISLELQWIFQNLIKQMQAILDIRSILCIMSHQKAITKW